MKNKVYYGEYSLKHWINLILSENITLPDYQRSFVWKQPQTERLIQAFQEDLYVPPVTIGVYQSDDGSSRNWVLDGQQRLTSILLAYLGIFPNEEKFGKKRKTSKSNKQLDEIEDLDNENQNGMEWTFKKIQEEIKKNNIRKVKDYFRNLPNSKDYTKLDIQIDGFENFLENHYLGFSLLVPQLDSEKNKELKSENRELEDCNKDLKQKEEKIKKQQKELSTDNGEYEQLVKKIEENKEKQSSNKNKIEENTIKIKENTIRERNKYYVSIFRAINIEGETLSNQENREALYYLDESLKNFFSPDFISSYTINTNDGTQKIDFVRYISIISDYRKNGINHIVKGTEGKLKKIEKYYETYISSVVADDNSTLFGKFSNDFENKEYNIPLELLKEYLSIIYEENSPSFESIIMVDLLMFGLVENVLFERKRLDIGRFGELRKKISKSYRDFKSITGHSNSPNGPQYIKERLQKSLDIYQEFIDESA